MNEVLTADKILETAEQVLRRFGPSKATVVDVARALGVSHGSVYRHFASKAALRDAVTERWLKRTSDPLQVIVEGRGSARAKLTKWFAALMVGKREKVHSDPELFAAAREIFAEARDVVSAHMATMIGQIAAILRDGVATGEFVIDDVDATAAAIFDATARFHDPAHAREWTDPGIDAAFGRVFGLILSGITAPKR
jgi:AcrR family transcriptional regulator